MGEQKTTASSVNRAKTYQLVLFPLNNGATNVYYVLVLSYIATFGSKVLALSMLFASVMVTGMRLFDAVTDPIIGALMDRTNGRFGKFRPFMVIGNLIMAASILVLYCLTPLIPASAMGLRYAAFVALYAVWVIGYTFQTSCTRSGQTVLTNDPKQRPLFTIFNTVGSLLGMGAMQFFAPILAKNYEGGYASAGFFRTLAPVGIVISILLTLLAVIGIWEKDQPKYFGIGGGVVGTVADAEEEDEQHGVQVDGQTVLAHQGQVERITVAPQCQQHKNANVADQRHTDIFGQAGFLALFLAGTDRQQEERHAEHIAQHHHGQVQPIVSAHHAAIQHAQHGGIVGDGQGQLGAGAGDHQPLHGLVFLDNLNILADLNLLRLFAADAKVLGLVLLPDADDGQDGQHDGHDDAYRGQGTEEPGGGIATLKVLGQDGSKELHDARCSPS